MTLIGVCLRHAVTCSKHSLAYVTPSLPHTTAFEADTRHESSSGHMHVTVEESEDEIGLMLRNDCVRVLMLLVFAVFAVVVGRYSEQIEPNKHASHDEAVIVKF